MTASMQDRAKVTLKSFVVERGVPLPPKPRPGPHPGFLRKRYPFNAMQIGDSFFVAGSNTLRIQASLVDAAKRAIHGDWTTRRVEGGVRIWRIK